MPSPTLSILCLVLFVILYFYTSYHILQLATVNPPIKAKRTGQVMHLFDAKRRSIERFAPTMELKNQAPLTMEDFEWYDISSTGSTDKHSSAHIEAVSSLTLEDLNGDHPIFAIYLVIYILTVCAVIAFFGGVTAFLLPTQQPIFSLPDVTNV